MRIGPSMLTSTAPSSGESKATVAAEWMTVSQAASAARPASSRPESVGADVAGDRAHPARGHLGEPVLAEVGAQPVEGVVLQDLPLHPLVDRRALARADEQGDLAVRHRSQQALEHRSAQEAGGTGEEELLASQRFTNHGLLSTIW